MLVGKAVLNVRSASNNALLKQKNNILQIQLNKVIFAYNLQLLKFSVLYILEGSKHTVRACPLE